MSAVKDLRHLRDRVLPVKVGRNAVSYVKSNFRKGGYNGRQWASPYRRKLSFSGSAGQYGTLLSRTDSLMNATNARPEVAKVYIENPTAYATIHNDGGTITVTARMKRYFWYRHIQSKGISSRNRKKTELSAEAQFWRNMALKKVGSSIHMPRRQFIGDNSELNKIVQRTIDRELKLFIQQHGRYS